ncbi:MAG: VTT domain-containing protein [Candidatus Limnocylindrales bacterium]|jgi:membrane-associated protein
MEQLGQLLDLILHPRNLIEPFGPLAYVILFAILFAETGLFAGFFLPGDSLLLVAGVLAAQGTQAYTLDLMVVIVVCVTAAILGNLVGFWFGRKVGRPLFERPDSRFFKRSHLEAADAFYQKHGAITIIAARFMPFVRTFAPIVAGVSDMERRKFVLYTVIGAFLWGAGLPIAGYIAGEAVGPKLDTYLLPIIVGIVALSILPPAIGAWRARRRGGSDGEAVAEPSPSEPLA